jgi:hypothetical protein
MRFPRLAPLSHHGRVLMCAARQRIGVKKG